MFELRLEVNLDITKRDIQPETIRRMIENAINGYIIGNGPDDRIKYVTLQSILINQPTKGK